METVVRTAIDHPSYQVVYSNTDVSADISKLTTSLIYTDYEHGQSDGLEIEVEDTRHRFKGEWYPDLSARLSAKIGYDDGRVLDCGEFELDEVEWSADRRAGDKVRIRALATVVSPSLRTARTAGYEGLTLAGIVEQIAVRNKLTLRGEIEAIEIDRETQNHQTDLDYLVRLAEDFGYACGVRGSYLDFWKIAAIEERAPIATFSRGMLKTFVVRSKTEATFREAATAYHDPDEKKLVGASIEQWDRVKTGDRAKFLKRAKSPALARRTAEAHGERLNKKQIAGSASLVGNILMAAGVNVAIVGNNRLDGIYHVDQSIHRMARSGGYDTDLEIHLVRDFSKSGDGRADLRDGSSTEELTRLLEDYNNYATTKVPGT